ncbi:hypothetical protein C9J60_08385 [Streptomyces sp. A244]|uniref:helix-turn-helix domain-containing protein n=1 Tax=Streptomyces sp. A244 TaxID=2137016 RepID=UPI000D19C2FB|nr:helix-turn-helix transcriptional regulator [Streptomyces sp. A244]PTH88841.1 hypothetical protein C9J60_08385 [Streptomyces sp. A244]
MNVKARPSREHQKLCRLFKKAVSESGRTYGEVEIATGISRSNVHQLVNGTDRRFPSVEKYVKIVRALGGDPTASEWLDPYLAAAESYGKDIQRQAIQNPDGTVTVIGRQPRAGNTAFMLSTMGDGLDGPLIRLVRPPTGAVAHDASKPQEPRGRGRRTGRGAWNARTAVIGLTIGTIMQSLLLHPFGIGSGEPDPPPASPASGMLMPAGQTEAIIWYPGLQPSPFEAIRIYDEPAGRFVIESAYAGERLSGACLLPDEYGDSKWVKVSRRQDSRDGFIPATFVRNADKLVTCSLNYGQKDEPGDVVN